MRLLLPPNIVWARSDHRPGRCPCMPASTARLRFPLLLGRPRSSWREIVSAFPRPVSSPLPSSTCAIRSLLAPGLSLTGVPSYLWIFPPSTHPLLPLPSSTVGPVPCQFRLIVLCLSSPCSLCIGIAVPVPRNVSWSYLEFNSSLGVILRKSLRPGPLHSLMITRQSPLPRTTRPFRRRLLLMLKTDSFPVQVSK